MWESKRLWKLKVVSFRCTYTSVLDTGATQMLLRALCRIQHMYLNTFLKSENLKILA